MKKEEEDQRSVTSPDLPKVEVQEVDQKSVQDKKESRLEPDNLQVIPIQPKQVTKLSSLQTIQSEEHKSASDAPTPQTAQALGKETFEMEKGEASRKIPLPTSICQAWRKVILISMREVDLLQSRHLLLRTFLSRLN